MKRILNETITFVDTSTVVGPLAAKFVDANEKGEFKTFNQLECELVFKLCHLIYEVKYAFLIKKAYIFKSLYLCALKREVIATQRKV